MMTSRDLSANLELLPSASSIHTVEEHLPRKEEDERTRRRRTRSEPGTSNSDDGAAETRDENPHLLDHLA
jgi:hypothetical protein